MQSNSRRSNPQRKEHFNKTVKYLEELRWQLNSYRKQHTNITHKHSNHANVYPNNRSFIYLQHLEQTQNETVWQGQNILLDFSPNLTTNFCQFWKGGLWELLGSHLDQEAFLPNFQYILSNYLVSMLKKNNSQTFHFSKITKFVLNLCKSYSHKVFCLTIKPVNQY